MAFLAGYAKSAIKSAQKRIDTVLDIQPEEDTEEEDNILLVDDSDVDSKALAELKDEASSMEDANKHETWQLDGPSEDDVVVSEPNPMRDIHVHGDHAVYPDSPTSLSPTDDARVAGRSRSHTNTDDTQASDHKDDLPVESSEIPLQHPMHFDPHHDEITTIASSDIEVIRGPEDGSTVSSYRPIAVDQLSLSNVPRHHSSFGNGENDQIPSLVAQIQMKNKTIDDLSASCKTLRDQKFSLTQQLKSLQNKISTLAPLKKEVEDQNAQIKQLYAEGKYLADENGRLSTKIKRLQKELSQLEVVQAARDEAIQELQIATKKLDAAEHNIKDLEAQLEEVENANEKVLLEMSQTQDDTEHTQQLVVQQSTKLEEAEKKVRTLEIAISKLEQEKLEAIDKFDAVQRSRLSLQTELAMKSNEVSGLMAEIDKFDKQVKLMKQDLSVAENRIRGYMEQESHTTLLINQGYGELHDTIQELKEEISRVSNERNELQQRCKNQEKIIADNKRELEQTAKDYQHRYDQLSLSHQKEVRQMEESCNRLRDQIKSLMEDLKKRDDERRHYQMKLDETILSNEKLAAQCKDTVKKIEAGCEKKIAESKTREKELQTQVETLQAEKLSAVMTPRPSLNFSNSAANTSGFFDMSPSTSSKLQNYSFIGDDESSALRQELAEANDRYEKIYKAFCAYRVDVKEGLQRNMDEAQIWENKYNTLLLEYGTRLEELEELKGDQADLRKIVKEQAEIISGYVQQLGEKQAKD